jgi:hypothetical protein
MTGFVKDDNRQRVNMVVFDSLMSEIEPRDLFQLAVCSDKSSIENLQCITQQSKLAQHTHGQIVAMHANDPAIEKTNTAPVTIHCAIS